VTPREPALRLAAINRLARRPKFAWNGVARLVARFVTSHHQSPGRNRGQPALEPQSRNDQADPPIPADSVGCRLFEHWTSSADRIRLLASSPKVRSQPSFANSFWISFQLSNLPVFAKKTARRYISSLRLRITHLCTINRWFGIGSWRPSMKLRLEPRRMSINVSPMSKAYVAIQRQCSRPFYFFHNTV
jgi:hypothetical protein